MASKFTAGMKNVVEVLNQMWDAYAAGPFNALPLAGGTVTGVVNINSPSIYGRYNSTAGGNAYLALAFNSIAYAYVGQATATTGDGVDFDFGIRAENALVFSAGGFGSKMKLFPSGNLVIGASFDKGDKLQVGGSLSISVSAAQAEVLKLSAVAGAAGLARTVIKMGYYGDGYGTRMVSGGDPTIGYSGYTSFETGDGPSGYLERMRVTNRGSILVGTTVDNAVDLMQVAGSGGFVPTGAQGTALLRAGLSGSVETLVLRAGNGALLPVAASAMYLGKNSNTDRGISTLGTVNTLGNDYAEYVHKCLGCGPVAKGQIVGITSDNTITDRWASAVLFSIKSTAPSFVGGDSWASSIGARPSPQAGPAPTDPPRRADVIEPQPLPGTEPQEYHDVVTPGDTDSEWAAKQAAYAAALAAHATIVQQDAEALATFEAALEIERQKVDRIAIAGRVPVNVLGASPGDYIVPVQDGEGIAGIAVHADDITMPQYLRAVGRVISIEPDGRAYVMVKAV